MDNLWICQRESIQIENLSSNAFCVLLGSPKSGFPNTINTALDSLQES